MGRILVLLNTLPNFHVLIRICNVVLFFHTHTPAEKSDDGCYA